MFHFLPGACCNLNSLQICSILLQVAILGISLGLWVRVAADWRKGRPLFPGSPPAPKTNSSVDLAGFIIGFLILPGIVRELIGDDPRRMIAGYQIRSVIFCLFVLVWASIRLAPPFRQLPEELQTLPRAAPIRRVWLGMWGFAIAYLPVSLLLLAVSPIQTPHPLIEQFLKNPTSEMWRALLFSAIVVAPLFEEFLFRVLLLNSLRQLLDPLLAILISSAIFAMIHGLVDAIPLYPLALVLGFLYYRTGSYLSVVTMHAMFNAYNLLQFRLSGIPS